MANISWWIEWIEGGSQRLPLTRAVRIGRAPDNDIVISDPTVSRYHCTVVASREECYVDARQARNGIDFGGQKVHDAVLLNGQEFAVHRARFRVLQSQAPAPTFTPVVLVPLFALLLVGILAFAIIGAQGARSGGASSPGTSSGVSAPLSPNDGGASSAKTTQGATTDSVKKGGGTVTPRAGNSGTKPSGGATQQGGDTQAGGNQGTTGPDTSNAGGGTESPTTVIVVPPTNGEATTTVTPVKPVTPVTPETKTPALDTLDVAVTTDKSSYGGFDTIRVTVKNRSGKSVIFQPTAMVVRYADSSSVSWTFDPGATPDGGNASLNPGESMSWVFRLGRPGSPGGPVIAPPPPMATAPPLGANVAAVPVIDPNPPAPVGSVGSPYTPPMPAAAGRAHVELDFRMGSLSKRLVSTDFTIS